MTDTNRAASSKSLAAGSHWPLQRLQEQQLAEQHARHVTQWEVTLAGES